MPTVADYLVIRHSSFEINSDTFSIPFELPGEFTVGLQFAKPIVQYIWHPLADNGHFRIWVNPPPGHLPMDAFNDPNFDTMVSFMKWGDEVGRDYGQWEAISGERFNVGGNTIHFGGTESGRVRFHNVILWYQRAI